MIFKDVFGGSKEPAVKAEMETKWKPKKDKAASKRPKRGKRF
tara:strand:+ start:362 stop:487 length:126 start_codon:yes stop_codon:yes gene_type:complete